MKILYPIEWTETDHMERPAKGWLSDVVVQTEDGAEYRLSFYDPVRLAQDIESELGDGKPVFTEPGLFVIPEVTKENIETAISHAEKHGYFQA